MEIANHERKMLNAMESNAKGNNNFVIKMMISEKRRREKLHFLQKIWKK